MAVYYFRHYYLKQSKLAIQIQFHGTARWMCLCEVPVLWIKWFVFLITSFRPCPLCDIQINMLPLAFVLFTLFPVFWGSHLSRIPLLLVLLPLLLILFFSFLLLSSSLIFHSFSFSCQPVACQQVSLCPGKNNGNNCCHWGRDSLLGILGYNSEKEHGKSSVMGWQEWTTYRYCPHYAKVKHWPYRHLLLICIHVAF